ncbi:MAG TPA: o-succinylbenzoate synthase [Bacillus bacterium]|uniref:o-succinylbenzoate synthase n=1 Tax=Siminovitchia fordii TaxID=254759 RepID=A0ABQ4K3U2_9BACI|nr:o-succinylbenzoate synthase [Siminovitchia fordii]GIN20412.1 o-succinylbenzoate synthase [Siminovitchia fordii]HBZ08333.1 o-succinylbenzoate synthase [Bacillus sp. (in: firmicutes)]
MVIEEIRLDRLEMPLKHPFETSFGKLMKRDFVVVSATSDGITGYGESTAFPLPFYNEESTETVLYILKELIIPQVLKMEKLEHPEDLDQIFQSVKGHRMAKAALEGAVWDLYCKRKGVSLSKALGGTKTEIDVGVSIGIEPTIEELLDRVGSCIDQGYKKIKVKIKPGFDVKPMEAIRERFGMDVPLMADANSAYTLQDVEILKQLDPLKLMMIEQPLAYDDIIDHATLQKELSTPICLDESIHSVEDARKAVEIGATKIINIKVGRVGGLAEAKKIHDYCQSMNIPVWCGGMLESGIGRAHNIAITSLSNFSIPGDTSPSDRYWDQDITDPEVEFYKPGVIKVPEGPGVGYGLNVQAFHDYVVHTDTFTRTKTV